jgi:hypothetical protein
MAVQRAFLVVHQEGFVKVLKQAVGIVVKRQTAFGNGIDKDHRIPASSSPAACSCWRHSAQCNQRWQRRELDAC